MNVGSGRTDSNDDDRPPRIHTARSATVGSTRIARALPQRSVRKVGAWCFVDVFTPGVGTEPVPGTGGVGPHPHCGLHTVTWLTGGELVHADTLGTEQTIRAGQVNLMTAGGGIVHAEAPGSGGEPVTGAQLWLAQPEATRHGDPRFAHHDDLPTLELTDGGRLEVLVGRHDGLASPAVVDHPSVGLGITTPVATSTTLSLDPAFDHAVVVLDGSATLTGPAPLPGTGLPAAPGDLVHLGPGLDELSVTTADATCLLVLGGAPLDEPLLMWWNFVVRTRDEASEATNAWNAGAERFGGTPLRGTRLAAPRPPWR